MRNGLGPDSIPSALQLTDQLMNYHESVTGAQEIIAPQSNHRARGGVLCCTSRAHVYMWCGLELS